MSKIWGSGPQKHKIFDRDNCPCQKYGVPDPKSIIFLTGTIVPVKNMGVLDPKSTIFLTGIIHNQSLINLIDLSFHSNTH